MFIPLDQSFLRATVQEGEQAVRSALSERLARYVGDPDLFDVRNAIDEARFFFGRRSLIHELADALERGQHVALVGPRKSGKTSLLNQLHRRLATLPVLRLDLQAFPRTDPDWPERAYAGILEAYDRWGRADTGPAWDAPATAEPCPAADFRRGWEARRTLQAAHGFGSRVVLLMDEMERVLPNPERVERAQAEAFLAFASTLRVLAEEERGRGLVMLVADWHARYNETNRFELEGLDTNPFFRFFRSVHLPPLDAEECREMLTEIGHAMGIRVDDAVHGAVQADSGGYAALARQLASAGCRVMRGADSKVLDGEHYRAGLRELDATSNELEVFFRENLWSAANEAERTVLARASSEGGATEDELDREELRGARRLLLATGLLERVDGGYRVRGRLFRTRVAEHRGAG